MKKQKWKYRITSGITGVVLSAIMLAGFGVLAMWMYKTQNDAIIIGRIIVLFAAVAFVFTDITGKKRKIRFDKALFEHDLFKIILRAVGIFIFLLGIRMIGEGIYNYIDEHHQEYSDMLYNRGKPMALGDDGRSGGVVGNTWILERVKERYNEKDFNCC